MGRPLTDINLGQLGLAGALALVVIWQLRDVVSAVRSELRELRAELASVREWLAAVHSRLGSLGADSIAPPVPEPVEPEATAPMRGPRRRRTPVAGLPTRPKPE